MQNKKIYIFSIT